LGEVTEVYKPVCFVKSCYKPFGDVHSWVVTLRGSQEWTTHVPYLQDRCWAQPDSEDYVEPKLVVDLIDSLPQPFDKPTAIFMSVFASADSSFKMCGLQSCVPMFQSLRDKFRAVRELSPTDSFDYQGGVEDGYEILGRFSSRDGDPANHFPFPLKVQDWADLYTKDNYDYFSNLYKFYTGANHVKMLFASAPANGLLQTTIGNTRGAATGDTFKAGNGVVVTHQSVWPSLDFTFPYQCEDEFNSIWEPVGMFPQIIDEEAVVSKYLISMSKDFRLFYLMPLPDFQLEAEFQSISQKPRTTCFYDELFVDMTNQHTNTIIKSDMAFEYMDVTVDAEVIRSSGAIDGQFVLILADSAKTVATTGVESDWYGVMNLIWTDVTNSGVNAFNYKQKFSFTNATAEDPALVLSIIWVYAPAAAEFDFRVAVTMQPCSSIVGLAHLTDRGIGGTYGETLVINDAAILVDVDQPVDVVVVNPSENPALVQVMNEVQISTESPIQVEVINTVPITFDGDVSVSQPLQVVGVADAFPVKVTGY